MVSERPSEVLFEEVWENVTNRIDLIEDNATNRHFLKSLVMGATVVAERVVTNCEGLARYWKNGDAIKAQGLTGLFFWILLSHCHYWIESEKEKKDGMISEQIAIKLLSCFGDINPTDFQAFLGLYKQYHHDLKNSPHLTHVSGLLLAMSCEICGHKCLDWSKINFPVKEMYHVVRKGAFIDTEPIRSVHDISGMKNALSAGVQAMTIYFDKAS